MKVSNFTRMSPLLPYVGSGGGIKGLYQHRIVNWSSELHSSAFFYAHLVFSSCLSGWTLQALKPSSQLQLILSFQSHFDILCVSQDGGKRNKCTDAQRISQHLFIILALCLFSWLPRWANECEMNSPFLHPGYSSSSQLLFQKHVDILINPAGLSSPSKEEFAVSFAKS